MAATNEHQSIYYFVLLLSSDARVCVLKAPDKMSGAF